MRKLIVTAIATLAVIAPTTAQASPGPALGTPESLLAQAVACDPGAAAGRPTVLLIHGTGATEEEAWAWNYGHVLPTQGFGFCTVRLPQRAIGDFGIAAEYAVYAARHAYQRPDLLT